MAETIELADVLDDDLCISSINAGASGTIDLVKNGDQILYLDQIGVNIALAIGQVTNPLAGFFERSIIGSATYSVSWDTAFTSKCTAAGLTLPTLGNGLGKRNNISFVWNRAEGASIDPMERLISVTNFVGKASAVPVYTAPNLVSAEVSQTNMGKIILNFDKAVSTGITGISFVASGGVLSVTNVSSGNNTSSPQYALSRNIINGETITMTIAVTNDITSTLGAVPFEGVTGQSVGTDTSPKFVSAEIGAIDSETMSVTFDRPVNITNVNGISIYVAGDAITVVSVQSGSGTSSIKFNLSRKLVNGETPIITIAPNNTITNTLTGIAFAGVANRNIENTVPVVNYATLLKAEAGEVSKALLTMTFDQSVFIVNATDITAIGSGGTQILVNGIISGSGSNVISIYMSRSLVTAETLTITIGANNTITSAIDGTPFQGVNTFPVNYIVVVASFVSTATPLALQNTNNGNGSVAYSNGLTMASTSATIADYIFLTYGMNSFLGKHVRVRIKNLVVNSGTFAIFSYTASFINHADVSASNSEYILDIPVWPSTNGNTLAIGDGGQHLRQFSITASKIYIEILP